MKITYKVKKKNSDAFIVAWGCYASCCIRSESGSNSDYMFK